MPPGILKQIGLLTTLLFTIPVVLAGVEYLLGGHIAIGIGLFCAALTMLVVNEYVTRPGDLPAVVAQKAISKIARSPDDKE